VFVNSQFCRCQLGINWLSLRFPQHECKLRGTGRLATVLLEFDGRIAFPGRSPRQQWPSRDQSAECRRAGGPRVTQNGSWEARGSWADRGLARVRTRTEMFALRTIGGGPRLAALTSARHGLRPPATGQRHDLRRPNRLSPHMPATSRGGSQPPNRHRAAEHGARVRAARGRNDGVGSVSRRRSIPMWENRFRNKIWHFMRTSASIATDAPACPPPPDSGFRRLSSHHPAHKRRGSGVWRNVATRSGPDRRPLTIAT
jgi:hypothetical protein